MGAPEIENQHSVTKRLKSKENFTLKKVNTGKRKIVLYDTFIYGLIFYLLINPKFTNVISKYVPNQYFKEVLAILFSIIYFLKTMYYD
jgi:hypothetical protein